MNEKLIELKNVTFTYDGDDEEEKRQSALTDIDLTINKGEFVAVLGHNGSGKSTLAKLCNAVYEPTEGTVTVKGIVSGSEENDDKIRRVVGMVFQNPDNQIVATIVEDDVAFGPENLGIEPKEIRKRVDDALKSVNMYELRHREPHKLSGGEKQRIALARAFLKDSNLYILDESTSSLDFGTENTIFDMIYNQLADKSMLIVAHRLSTVRDCDLILVMDHGEIVERGTHEELLEKKGKYYELWNLQQGIFRHKKEAPKSVAAAVVEEDDDGEEAITY